MCQDMDTVLLEILEMVEGFEDEIEEKVDSLADDPRLCDDGSRALRTTLEPWKEGVGDTKKYFALRFAGLSVTEAQLAVELGLDLTVVRRTQGGEFE